MILSAKDAAAAVIEAKRQDYERAILPIMEEIQLAIAQRKDEAIVPMMLPTDVRERLHTLGYKTFDYGNATRVSFAHLMSSPEE